MPAISQDRDFTNLLRSVVRGQDRSSPLAFVGREHERGHFRDALLAARDGYVGNVSLYQGAPGMGKTALMNACIQEMQSSIFEDAPSSRRGRDPALCLNLDVSDLASPPLYFVRTLLRKLAEWEKGLEKAGKLVLKAYSVAKTDQPIQDIKDKLDDLRETSSLVDCLNAYSPLICPGGATLSISIDEMQTCGPRLRGAALDNARDIMQGLFLGNATPRIAVSCFGLPSTEGLLRGQLGLSRLPRDAVRQVDLLPEDQWKEMAQAQLRSLGMLPGGDENLRRQWLHFAGRRGFCERDADAWGRKAAHGIAERSQGFPQHVATGVMDLCASLQQCADQFSPKENLHEDIERRHAASKKQYYSALMASIDMPEHEVALAALSLLCDRNAPDGVPEHKALSLLELCGGKDEARAAWRAAHGKGLLHRATVEGERGGVGIWHAQSSRIPSLTGYLADAFRAHVLQQTPAAMRLHNELGVNIPQQQGGAASG